MPLMTPIVNNNGTSRAMLIEQRTKVMDALYNVMQALKHNKPHGRDYEDTEKFDADTEIWQTRYDTIKAIRLDIMAEAITLYNGEHKK